MKICSHNEWDNLKSVIIGNVFDETTPVIDFSYKVFFHDNIYGTKHESCSNYITKRHVIEHAQDIESLCSILRSHNVTVYRPAKPKLIQKCSTPNWKSSVHSALNVRDMCMIVGDTVIETPPTCRWRYFENDYIKHILHAGFLAGARWIQAPKPLLLDRSFDLDHFKSSPAMIDGYLSTEESTLDMGHEIMFDAANCVRLGRDIIINTSNENQLLGARWLQDVLGTGYNIHNVNITDSHIDSSFLPLKPGVALVMREDIPDSLPDMFNDWDLIYIPMRYRDQEEYSKQGIKLASPRIELNVLSVSPNTIICHDQYQDILNKKLNKHNIEAIGSPMRHCELFSGAHHCVSVDLHREGRLESYFET